MRFVTFEGGEGCGKSTQLQLTAGWLRGLGEEVCVTFEPGGTEVGAAIRTLLLGNHHQPGARTELLLFLADRAQHVQEVIAPALRAGKWVLCDRYTDSTLAYQLAGRGLEEEVLPQMLAFAEGGCRPDLTLWLDMPVPQALARLQSRKGEISRLDAESVAFHERVREGFASLRAREPERICTVDASADIDAVQEAIRTTFLRRWPELS